MLIILINPVMVGKKISLILAVVVVFSALIYADYRITRGPEVGEIYFIGPTVTESVAIYRSTDFGETVTCMDSTLNTNINFFSITADLTPGVLYGTTTYEALYISYDYGQEGSWQFRNTAHWCINSGRNEGKIYDSFSKHSEDYGVNFIQHSANGFFGSSICTEIDNENNIGHMLVSNYQIIDSLWILITYDNFESLEIQNVVNRYEFPIIDLSRGTENGELYFVTSSPQTLFHSTDYGSSWQYINEFNSGLDYTDFVGGRQLGEVYVLVTYTALMHTVDHTYIFHSIDYGKTFTVYHSFSKGEEPLAANFSSSLTEGEAPFTVQFSNYSVGEIISYEWDFDNNGTIDSYEQNPEFTYQDTGYYSVKLTIYDQDDTDEFLREDLIHVTNESGVDNYELQITNYNLSNYPNPFNPTTTISFETKDLHEDMRIEIFNLKGQKVDQLQITNYELGINEVTWNAESFASGIYFYKLLIDGTPIAKQKCILLK